MLTSKLHSVLLLSATILAGCSSAESAKPATSPLIGAWESHVQFNSGAFASIKDMRFAYVFNTGGTMMESSNYDANQPVPPAYGVWREISPNKFDAKYIYYITKPPTAFQEIASGGGWLPIGHGVLRETITLSADGNTFDSTIHYEAFDMSGRPMTGGGDATTHGTRITF